jgi:hypothetical protein
MGLHHEDQPFTPMHGRRPHLTRRRVLTAVVFAGVVAGCGTSSSLDTEAASPSNPDKITVDAGSDRHLEMLSNEAARRANPWTGSDRHLANLSREISRHTDASIGSDRHLEELARQAGPDRTS